MNKKLRIFAFFLALMMFSSVFFALNFQRKTASASVEDYIYNKIDIIDKYANGVTNATISSIGTPFDESSGSAMTGNIFTPTSDDYGQASNVFSVSQFNLDETKSIFLWVYIPGDYMPFDLIFSVGDIYSNSLKWEISHSRVVEMSFGWKFVELKVLDAEIDEDSDFVVADVNFSWFRVKFSAASDISQRYVPDDLSLYHVFSGSSYSKNSSSGVVYLQASSYYSLRDDFLNHQNVYINDRYTFSSVYQTFNYVYSGKYDLKNYSLPGEFEWSIEITSPNSAINTLRFGESYDFESTGWYNIKIAVYRINQLEEYLILSCPISVFVNEFNIGSFVAGNSYSMKINEKNIITFNISPNFIADSEVSFEVENNNIAEIESYYEKDGTYYVTIVAKSSGTTNLVIQASGHRTGYETVKNYSKTATIKVKKEVDNTLEMILLWSTFGVFVLVFIIFVINSLVKARKNDVK